MILPKTPGIRKQITNKIDISITMDEKSYRNANPILNVIGVTSNIFMIAAPRTINKRDNRKSLNNSLFINENSIGILEKTICYYSI
jgi:hypothetical protein